MGNIIESESTPDALEEDNREESSAGSPRQSDICAMPGLLTAVATEARLQTPVDPGDRNSCRPSRVFVQEEDSTLLPDARGAQSRIEPTANASTDPADGSFPLSESELPATFDTSLDPAESSDFFVNPPPTKSVTDDQLGSRPPVEVEAVTASDSAMEVESLLTCLEPDSSVSLSPSAVLPLSASASRHRKSLLSRDAPPFIPSQNGLVKTSEQFSRLESTVSSILSSPVLVSAEKDCTNASSSKPAHAVSPAASAKPENDIQTPESPTVVYPAVRPDQPRCPAPTLPQDLPLTVTTYADATNLAMQFPEHADLILTLPLPKPAQLVSDEEKEESARPPPHVLDQEPFPEPPSPRPLSPSLHHPDRPHWAAAALLAKSKGPETLPAPQTRDNTDINHTVGNSSCSSPRSRRNRRQCPRSSIQASRHKLGSRPPESDESGRRRDPQPHHGGADSLDHPSHLGVPRKQRLSISSDPLDIGPKGSVNDTGAIASRTQEFTRGSETAPAFARHTPPATVATERSDVGADHKPADGWDLLDVNRLDVGPNATNLPPDGKHREASSILGQERLGRHIISPHAINVNHKPARSISRRAHKQQVAELNIAARRYLGQGSDRESRRASSSASSNRSVEETGIADTSPAESAIDKHLLERSEADGSIPGSNLPPSKATAAEEELTPMLRSGESPLRGIQLRIDNMHPAVHRSPKASADTQVVHGIFPSPKPHVSPRITSSSSSVQENQPVGDFSGAGSEWLVPPEHTVHDWLIPPSLKPQASSRITSLASQENQLVGSFRDAGSEWLVPPEHTVGVWLPFGSASVPSFQNALSPSQILHSTKPSAAFLPPPKVISDTNHPVQGANTQHPFGVDPQTKGGSANWFGNSAFTVPSDDHNLNCPGPGLDDQRRYPRRARQSLPAQSEVFAQHLAEAYPSHPGSEGRRGRGRGRGARSPSSQNPRQR
ncbi:hypothetical protein LshimejAT787_0109340 [Lyophyllum shimeji]|uniref:Uncharacterized protein n=1 Tax=Lyophyllum shimeji TaxID=47721 RepID=A0A9P3PDN8_LYOSH|nr:hypothetical protein LshimejAT787_0109340 [Lyophyllum shimeji]